MRRLLLLAMLLAAATVDGATYYVTPNGSGARTGSSWSNAGNGIDWINPRIQGGDTVFFGSGRYHGQLQIPRNTNSRDRTCYACTSFVSNYPCTLSAAAYVPGNTLTWQQVSGELYKAYYNLPFPSMENDFDVSLLYCAGEDTTLLRACTDRACITTAARGSFYLNPSQDTFFVRTARGDHPSLHTFWMGGRSLVNIAWNDSTMQYFTLYGFDIRYHQFGAISLHASSDSIFIDRCKITRIASSEQNNGGAVACNNVMSAADAGGREQTYRWDGKYNRVKNCVINTIYEPIGGSDTRCCVVTTYSQSHFVVESCLVEGIGGLMHPKNRSIGGYSYGNVARYNVCRNMIGAAYHTMNFQRNDSCYGNIFINSIGAVYLGDAMEPSGPGHYFGNNTIYGLRNQEIFRPHPGGSPPTQNMAPNWAKYNIFYDDNASSGYIMAFYGAEDDTSWVIDSNLYYNCESTFYGGSATNLAGWQSRLSGVSVAGGSQRRHDLNSPFNTKNPGFASIATGDFSRPGQTTNEMQVTYGGRTWTRFGAVQPGSAQVNAPSPLGWIAVDSLRSDYSAETDSLRVRFLTSGQSWPDSVIIAVSTSGFPSAYQGSNRWALPYAGANTQGARLITLAVLESDTLTAAGWIFDRDSGLSSPVLIDKQLLQSSAIMVLSPNGGESWLVGSNQNITWSSVGSLPNVRIEYSTNGGTSWATIITSTANDGSHVWTVPSVLSSSVLIRIADTDGSPFDVSNGQFTIVSSTLDLLVSTVADSVRCDFAGEQDSIRIRWQTTVQTLGDSVVYALSTNGTLPTYTATSNRGATRYFASSTGSAYLLPTITETDTVIAGAWVKDGTNYSGGRYDTLILTLPTTLTVTSPNGGQSWLVGSNQTITWSSAGSLANVRIEYSTNGGTSWATIITSTANDGSYVWTVPSVSSTNVLIRVADIDGSPSDVSNTPFTILSLDPPIWAVADSVRCDFSDEQDSIRIRWQSTSQTLGDSVVYALTTNGTLPTFTATSNRGAIRYFASTTGSAYLLPFVSETDTIIAGVWVKDGVNYSSGRYDTLILTLPMTFAVISPNGGESWPAGSSQTITWGTIASVPYVRIEYSSNGGTNWTSIISSTANDGSHPWTVPSVPSTSVLIRVADTDGSPSDVSNGPFTISTLNALVWAVADSVRCDFAAEQDSIRIGWQTTSQTFGDSVIYVLTTDGTLPAYSMTSNRGAARYIPGATSSGYLLPTVYEPDTIIVGVWVKDGTSYSAGRYSGLILFRPPRITSCPPCTGLTGNVDGSPDGVVDPSDFEALLTYFFTPGAAPDWICYKQANVDGSVDGVVDGSDLDLFVMYLFDPDSGVTFAPCR